MHLSVAQPEQIYKQSSVGEPQQFYNHSRMHSLGLLLKGLSHSSAARPALVT